MRFCHRHRQILFLPEAHKQDPGLKIVRIDTEHHVLTSLVTSHEDTNVTWSALDQNKETAKNLALLTMMPTLMKLLILYPSLCWSPVIESQRFSGCCLFP